jgi:hypothetical protein
VARIGNETPALAIHEQVELLEHRLPDQDLRITEATPAAKMSVDLLWQEYKADASKAGRAYHGRAIEITGHPESIPGAPPPDSASAPSSPEPPSPGGVAPTALTFAQPDGGKVTARLLADRAAATLEAIKGAPRITLRCFVEGPSPDSKVVDVVLKSCVLP